MGGEPAPRPVQIQSPCPDKCRAQLSAKRRVTVQDFKKMTFVALREFYDKDGELKPGKSGINLKVEQFVELVKALPDIIEVLKSKGLDVEAIDKD